MSGNRLLIVNADDFGRSPGINAGIIEAHRQGIVTSTTLMVNLPWTLEAVAAAQDAQDLAIGLHLNFCYGNPVADPDAVPSLVETDGSFVTDTRQLAATADVRDIRTETIAQLERFRSVVGREPTHLDSHKYLHSTLRFAPVVAAVANAHGLPIRATDEGDRMIFATAGLAVPDAFEGRFHGLDGDGVELALLVELIEKLQPGVTELMCHPGYVDEHIQDSSYRNDRQRELEVLCSAGILRALERGGVKLATFLDLKKGA